MIKDYLKNTKEEDILKNKIKKNKDLYDLEMFNKLIKTPFIIMSSIFFLISMVIIYFPVYIQDEINNKIMEEKNYISYLVDLIPVFQVGINENFTINTDINTNGLYRIIFYLDINIDILYTIISSLFFIIISMSIFYILKLIKKKEEGVLKEINKSPREIATIATTMIMIVSSVLLIISYQTASFEMISAFSLISSILIFGLFILLKIISLDLKKNTASKDYTQENFIIWAKKESILKDENQKLKNKIIDEYSNDDLLNEIKKINIHDYDDSEVKKIDSFVKRINEFNKKEEKKKEWINLLVNKEKISIKNN